MKLTVLPFQPSPKLSVMFTVKAHMSAGGQAVSVSLNESHSPTGIHRAVM